MKIRVGNVVFEEQRFVPVMVELTPQDKENIANMHPDCTKYAVFPDDWGTVEEMQAWMRHEDEGGPAVPKPPPPADISGRTKKDLAFYRKCRAVLNRLSWGGLW